jgi:hypothetical protein
VPPKIADVSNLSSVELGVLGPLRVRKDGASAVIPGAKPRAILTMLGLHSGSVVPADTLVELLWGQDPPRTAAKALQTSLVPDYWVEPAEVLALSNRGVVGLEVIKGTTTDGVAIEIPLIQLILIEGDRVTHIEDFDPDQCDFALARFNELTGKDQPK